MADAKISALPAAAGANDTDELPANQAGTTRKVTRAQVVSGLAPSDATYITQTASSGLSAEQALGSLASGLVKNTTTTGVLSIATEGTDYYQPGGTAVALTDLAANSITINGNAVTLGDSVTLTLASSDFANQGTTTMVLHGNGAGNPSFAAVDLANDVTGNLGVSHLNSG